MIRQRFQSLSKRLRGQDDLGPPRRGPENVRLVKDTLAPVRSSSVRAMKHAKPRGPPALALRVNPHRARRDK